MSKDDVMNIYAFCQSSDVMMMMDRNLTVRSCIGLVVYLGTRDLAVLSF
jgi:hypothetical protein